MADTNPLADAPSVRVCRFARLELADMIDFGTQCIALPRRSTPPARRCKPGWRLLDACLAAAGGLDGTAADRRGQAVARRHSASPYVYDPIAPPRRAVSGPLQPGSQRRGVPLRPRFPTAPKTLDDALQTAPRDRRARDDGQHHPPDEGQALGLLSRHVAATLGRGPARDDGRGRLRRASGVDWTQARITHNWSLRLNTECTPLERHAVLYFIEQGLMPKTGKRFEWEVGVAVGRSR